MTYVIGSASGGTHASVSVRSFPDKTPLTETLGSSHKMFSIADEQQRTISKIDDDVVSLPAGHYYAYFDGGNAGNAIPSRNLNFRAVIRDYVTGEILWQLPEQYQNRVTRGHWEFDIPNTPEPEITPESPDEIVTDELSERPIIQRSTGEQIAEAGEVPLLYHTLTPARQVKDLEDNIVNKIRRYQLQLLFQSQVAEFESKGFTLELSEGTSTQQFIDKQNEPVALNEVPQNVINDKPVTIFADGSTSDKNEGVFEDEFNSVLNEDDDLIKELLENINKSRREFDLPETNIEESLKELTKQKAKFELLPQAFGDTGLTNNSIPIFDNISITPLFMVLIGIVAVLAVGVAIV